jgi:hypothetical protein
MVILFISTQKSFQVNNPADALGDIHDSECILKVSSIGKNAMTTQENAPVRDERL